MTDSELLEYYERYKSYQAGVINMSLNLEDLMRLIYLLTKKELDWDNS